mgnify:CR=1 FL=1
MLKCIEYTELEWSIRGILNAVNKGRLTEAQAISEIWKAAQLAADKYLYTFGESVHKD